MSDAKGPYTLNEDDAGRYVISDMPSHLATFESHLDASVAVLIANLAHAHALAAQAERVKEACDAWGAMCLAKSTKIDDTKWVERWTFDEPLVDRMGNAVEALKNALTPPAKGGT